jgi:hypothetical protein
MVPKNAAIAGNLGNGPVAVVSLTFADTQERKQLVSTLSRTLEVKTMVMRQKPKVSVSAAGSAKRLLAPRLINVHMQHRGTWTMAVDGNSAVLGATWVSSYRKAFTPIQAAASQSAGEFYFRSARTEHVDQHR